MLVILFIYVIDIFELFIDVEDMDIFEFEELEVFELFI